MSQTQDIKIWNWIETEIVVIQAAQLQQGLIIVFALAWNDETDDVAIMHILFIIF